MPFHEQVFPTDHIKQRESRNKTKLIKLLFPKQCVSIYNDFLRVFVYGVTEDF